MNGQQRPPAVVIAGVSGIGKTTVARLLADRWDAEFVEGDSYHSAESVRKMSAGVPLDDDDRQGWLERLARTMSERAAAGHRVVMTCSALKRSYRDLLRQAGTRVITVMLTADRGTLEQRHRLRQGHFMPPALLDSQLQTLEPLAADEPDVVSVSSAGDPDTVVAAVLAALADLEPAGRVDTAAV